MPIGDWRGSRGWAKLALGLVVIATVFYPGDAPWISDEPLLLHGAVYMNSTPGRFWGISLPFSVAPYGLIGTRGVHYGPLAVWIDQIFLAFTHDPIRMIAIRAGAVAAIDAVALYWLAKSVRVTPWIAVAVMVSPWLWLYSRQLWDNSLCVPVSAMLLAAYADFIATHRAWSLRLAILCGMLLLLLHLMAIPLIAAIGLHLAIFEWRSLVRLKWSVAAIVGITIAVSWAYWWNLLHHHPQAIPGGSSAWRGYFFPLLGAHHLTGYGLENVLGEHWLGGRSLIAAGAEWISMAAFAAVWMGMMVSIARLWRAGRRWREMEAIGQIGGVCWGAVLLQCGLDGWQRLYDGPHYFNASWIVYAAFLFLVARHARGWMIAIYGASLLVVTAGVAISIHENGGMWSENYGSAISSQIDAVRQIRQYSGESPIRIDIPQWTEHPIALRTLGELMPAAMSERPRRRIWVHYADDSTTDAHIIVTAY